ncbi:MAG: TauD/TfdA family dioxygenase [Gammaproteobacteria bacterium]|nr:TauD/TfdA family dioxygenase [Gammaproteobacteria bacterium]
MTKTVTTATEFSMTNENPFDLDNAEAYQKWRDHKLAGYPLSLQQLVVKIGDIRAISDQELKALKRVIRQHNMVVYQLASESQASKAEIRQFARLLGLDRIDNNICSDEDSITSLQVSDSAQKRIYIPYTNRRLSWHADGYYNPLDKQIRGMLLHCVQPAVKGGENMLLDHEMIYIQLRDENPDYIRALMHPQAMIIPPNNEGEQGDQIRGEQAGPVFSLENGTANLHMRYSARSRNIIWRDDVNTSAARAKITDLLDSSPYILRYRLGAGQGVICNNLLHNRTSFEDSDAQHRLLYRARFYDRVADTAIAGIMNQVNENVIS